MIQKRFQNTQRLDEIHSSLAWLLRKQKAQGNAAQDAQGTSRNGDVSAELGQDSGRHGGSPTSPATRSCDGDEEFGAPM